MAHLAILQPDARASARLIGAIGDSHRVVVRDSWEALEELVSGGEVHGCLVDALHPDRAEAERRIRRLRSRDLRLAIIAYVDPDTGDRFYDLGGLGVDGLATSSSRKQRLRADVDQALSVARGRAVARALDGRFPEPGPSALRWAVVHATHETSVDRMATALGLTTRALRDRLHEAGLPSPARVLLWGRLLLAGARLADDCRSLEDVAFSLGYATSNSLARAMKQHTGHTPREISERGGMELVRSILLPGGGAAGPAVRGAMLAAVAALCLSASACASLGLGSGGVDRGAIRDILESPGIAQMHVGVLAIDAESGRTLYEHNAERKFVPASNQKILVTAAATTMLGPEHTFRTEVWSTGPLSRSRLDGDLVVVASGDPSLSDRFWPSGTAALEALADSLRATGLEHVHGRLYVDVSTWDSTTVGPTWEVEDLRYGYGATGGAFAIDEGEVRIVVEGGATVGAAVRVSWAPLGTHGYVRSRLTTSPPDSLTRVRPSYLPESRRLVLDGRVALGTVDTLAFALRDPVREASAALWRAIDRAGIEVTGSGLVRWSTDQPLGRRCATARAEECPGARRLAVLESPPLSALIAGILEPSQNWMTEQLLRSLGAAFGEEGSWSEGVDVLEAFLVEHVGVDTLDVTARDGSGLSAYNLVTPRALVRVLRHVREGPHGEAYRRALAEPAEEDSSLERRLVDLEGRVFAKTGTISNVNSLSGYLVRNDGRTAIFSILTNGSGLPSAYVRGAIDDIVRALAGRAASNE